MEDPIERRLTRIEGRVNELLDNHISHIYAAVSVNTTSIKWVVRLLAAQLTFLAPSLSTILYMLAQK